MIGYLRKAKSHLILASLLFFTIGYADNHSIYEEGRHYKKLGLAESVTKPFTVFNIMSAK